MRIGDGLIGPVHVLRLEVGNVTLRSAKMPAQLVKVASFRVFLPLKDESVFLDSDGALGLEANLRPEALGHERPGQPVHRKAKVVWFPQMDIGADGAGLEAGKKLLRLSLDDHTIANQVQCRLLCGPPPAILG